MLRILSLTLIGLSLSACQTVKMPKLDFLRSSEFQEDSQNISNSYPAVSEVPSTPKEIRSAAQWDKDVRELMALEDKLNIPDNTDAALSDAEVDARMQELRQRVRAYQADDHPERKTR